MITWHVVCCGPSVTPFLGRDWSDKRVFLVNGMPMVWTSQTREMAWVMVDPVLPAMGEWASNPCPYDRYCTRFNAHQVKDGIFIRHSESVVWDDPMTHGFLWQRSVGHVAVQLARVRGAEEIVVWGLDYTNRDRCCNEAYAGKPKEAPWVLDSIETGWEKVRQGMFDLNQIMVWNANPNSGLKALIKLDDPEEAWRK